MENYPQGMCFPVDLEREKKNLNAEEMRLKNRDHTYCFSGEMRWKDCLTIERPATHMKAIFIGICSLSKAFNSLA